MPASVRAPGPENPPLRPLQGLRARFAGSQDLPEQRGWVTGITLPVYPPGIPHPGTTLVTHPVYPPWYPPALHTMYANVTTQTPSFGHL